MTAAPRAATGIVLAGGRSSRFGRDKLREPVNGQMLVDRAIESVQAVCADVVVVAAPDAQFAVGSSVRLVRDPTAFQGPLAGCLAGLTAAREPLALVVGGDMPGLQPEVLALMLRSLERSSADACVLESRGQRHPLPIALRTGAATALVTRLLGEHERRLRAILERMPLRILTDADWRSFDPEGVTLRDVDVPEDLDPGGAP